MAPTVVPTQPEGITLAPAVVSTQPADIPLAAPVVSAQPESSQVVQPVVATHPASTPVASPFQGMSIEIQTALFQYFMAMQTMQPVTRSSVQPDILTIPTPVQPDISAVQPVVPVPPQVQTVEPGTRIPATLQLPNIPGDRPLPRGPPQTLLLRAGQPVLAGGPQTIVATGTTAAIQLPSGGTTSVGSVEGGSSGPLGEDEEVERSPRTVVAHREQPTDSRVSTSIPPAHWPNTNVLPMLTLNDFDTVSTCVPAVTNKQSIYQIPATAGLHSPSSVNYDALRTITQPASSQLAGSGRTAVQPPSSSQRLASASQTAIIYSANHLGGTTGMNFNIMGANKPTKLDRLYHENIKRFESNFTQYHYKTNGQATLLGHISDDVVEVIDSLLGAHEEHQHLLCHGDDVNVRFLSEYERASRPWLYTSEPANWIKLLETLLSLNPAGGAYVTQTYENLVAKAEDPLAH